MNQHLAVPSLWEVGSLWCMGVSGAFCALRSAHCPRGKLFELGRLLASDQRTTLARIGHDTLNWQVLVGTFDHGWQFCAAWAVEERFSSSTIWPQLSQTEHALFRSHSRRMSGLPFTLVPSSPTFLCPHLFRVLPPVACCFPASVLSHLPSS